METDICLKFLISLELQFICTMLMASTKNLIFMHVVLVQSWAFEHHLELIENWDRIKKKEPVKKIPGADRD